MGPSLNRFEPSFDDLVSLSTEFGTVNLYCQVKFNASSASNYALWLVGYFDGTKQGGATFGLIMLVVDVVTFVVGLPGLWAMGSSIVGLLRAGWEALKRVPAALAKLQIFLIEKAQAFVTAVTKVGTAIAEKAGVIIAKVGGSLGRAADAARALARDTPEFRRLMGLGDAVTDGGVVVAAEEKGVVGWYERLRALGGNLAGGGGGTGVKDFAAVEKEWLKLAESKNPGIRWVKDQGELRTTFDDWTREGSIVREPRYEGTMYELPDGTRVGLRFEQGTKIPYAIDVRGLGNAEKFKVHINPTPP